MRRMDARVLSGQPRISKSLLNARLCRLTETARLLKNVKSVFSRRSNAASRVSVEVELSRKLSLPQTLAHIRRNSRIRCQGSVPPPNRSSESIVLPRNCDPRETTFSHGGIIKRGGKTALMYFFSSYFTSHSSTRLISHGFRLVRPRPYVSFILYRRVPS